MAVARVFVQENHTHEDGPTLHHWRGTWWAWRKAYWSELDDRAVRSALYAYTENATCQVDNKPVPWLPTRRKIGDVFEALAAICILDSNIDQPSLA